MILCHSNKHKKVWKMPKVISELIIILILGTSDEISTINDKSDPTDGGEIIGPTIQKELTSNADNSAGHVLIPVSPAGLLSTGIEEIKKGGGVNGELKLSPITAMTHDDEEEEHMEKYTAKSKYSSEVPDSVSKLSNQVITSLVDSSDSKRPRKKRSSKLENVKCDCEGVCQCVVCSPEIISKRVEMTGNSDPPIGESDLLCCCTALRSSQSHPHTSCQVNQVYMQTQLFANCECTSCKLDCNSNAPKYKTEAFLKSTNLDTAQGAIPKAKKRTCLDDIFNPPCQIPADCWTSLKRSTHTHSVDCECIDCLCLPKIQKIAQMREFPIVRDEKQIYQVTTMKCSCINAVNAKKHVAERSRIPISTNSTAVGPPKIKPTTLPDCACDDCDCCLGDCSSRRGDKETSKSEPTKFETIQDNTGQSQRIKLTLSQLAKMCDCEECSCKVCFNKPAKDGDAEKDNPLDMKQSQAEKGKSSHPELCDCLECQCKVCFITPVQQKMEGSANKPPDMKPSQMDKTKEINQKKCCCKEECNCEICLVDIAQAKTSTTVPKDSPVTPKESKVVSIAPSAVSHGDACDCQICACPNAAAIKTEAPVTVSAFSEEDSTLQHPEDCDCEVCNCPLSGNLTKEVAKDAGDIPEHPDDCDCGECVNCTLSPGKVATSPDQIASTKPSRIASTKPSQIASTKSSQIASTKPSQIASAKPSQVIASDCKCDLCKCTNMKDSQAKGDQSQKPSSSVMPTPDDRTHMDCDCVDCKCDPCADPKKKRAEKPIATKMMPCDCSDCRCNPCADPSKQKPQDVIKTDLEKGDARIMDVLPTCTCEICGCPGKDKVTKSLKDSHPDDCDCADCMCAEEIMQTASEFSQKGKAGHPDGCICAECKCSESTEVESAAKNESLNAKTNDHPEGCICAKCECPGINIDDFKGKPVVHPSGCICGKCLCAQETSHEKGCNCVECTCTECFYKNDRAVDAISCKCGDCICKECFKINQPSDKTSRIKPTPTGDTRLGQKINECACGDCICVDCYYKKDNYEMKECKCGVCTCHDCQFSVQVQEESKKQDASVPAVTTRSCHCIDCECDVCSKEDRKKKDKPTDMTELIRTSEPIKTSTHPDGCACMTCLCIECFSKVKNVKCLEDTSKPKAASSGRSPNCKCIDCLCEDCCAQDSKPIVYSAEQICHCMDCKCDDCLLKKTQSEIKPIDAGKACICTECKDDCLIEEPAGWSCHCPGCGCSDCSHKEKKAPSSGKAQILGDQPTLFLDPPRFEVPMRRKCDINTCSCVICDQKTQVSGSATDGSPSDRTAFTTNEAPPFEVPIRLPCSCTVCICTVCSKDGTSGINSAAAAGKIDTPNTTPMVGTTTLSTIPPATLEAPPFQSIIRQPCTCGTCTCTYCNKDSGQLPPSAGVFQKSAVIADKKSTAIGIPCDCPPCACFEGAMRGTQPVPQNMIIQQSNLPKQSAPIISLTESEPMPCRPNSAPVGDRSQFPIHCDCPTCTCPDTAVNFNAGKFDSSSNQPMSKLASQMTGKVSHISGKQSEKLVANQLLSDISGKQSENKISNQLLFNYPVPCNCPKCICSTEAVNDQQKNISEKVSRVTYQDEAGKTVDKPSNITEQTSRITKKQSGQNNGTQKHSPILCDCADCSCPGEKVEGEEQQQSEKLVSGKQSEKLVSGKQSEKLVSGKQSEKLVSEKQSEKLVSGKQSTKHVSGKQSEKLISVHQSGSPSPCNCAECRCLNDALNYYSGKFVVGQNVREVASSMSSKHSKIAGKSSAASGKDSKVIAEQKLSKHPAKCDCSVCTECVECPDPSKLQKSTALPSRTSGMEASKKNEMPERDVHSNNCNCPACCICPSRMEEIDVAKMDSDTLKKEIQTNTKENCECREQIKEIKRALNKIKCACTEAELKAVKNKPLVKQASAFGQTMSGLKLALNNLQEKCKAKDKMIDAMTGELKMRTSSNTFENVLNTRIAEAPDYDKAEDVKSFDKSRQEPFSTNILYPVEEENDFAEKLSRAMANEKTHKSRKKSSKTCGCGKPHKEKENVKLIGFEVTDIRRITEDSIIIKWKPPKSSSVTGYDIFINGVNKSKVMSGGRTSAMIHSLDLSATIQVTIYAVTKCGRCEPPAIAIYEIRTC